MTQNLKRQARSLAARPYSRLVLLDETTDGKPGYVASVPELPGCMSDGQTRQEALDNLKDATFEYILSLLEDGLPVPAPGCVVAETMTTGGDVQMVVIEP